MGMDSRQVSRAVTAAGVLLLFGSACSAIMVPAPVVPSDPSIGPCAGVTVVVDERATSRTGDRSSAEPRATCAETDATITAQAAFIAANGPTITGTADSGSAVICRVDGTPNSNYAAAKPGGGIYFETCTSTPPEYAHWVLWHKGADKVWNKTGQDFTSLDVAPGDVVALVYTYRDEPSTPSF